MKKKKKPTERNPDLTSADDQKELEAKVDQMLELSKEERRKLLDGDDKVEKPSAEKSIEDQKTVPTEGDSNPVVGPPILPEIKKRKSITVLHHDEEATDQTEEEVPSPSSAQSKKTSIAAENIEDEPIKSAPSLPVDETTIKDDVRQSSKKDIQDDSVDASNEQADKNDTPETDEDIADIKTKESDDSEPVASSEPEAISEPLEKDLAAAIEEVNERLRKHAEPPASDEQIKDAAEASLDSNNSEDVVADDGPQDNQEEIVPKADSKPVVKPGLVNNLAHLQSPKPTPTEQTLEDTQTDKAIAEIVAKESDDLLAAEDALAEQTFAPPKKIKKFTGFRKLFSSTKAKLTLVLVLIASIAAVMSIPDGRYAVLNSVGVRGGMSLHIIDQSSLQPLRGVSITLAGQTVETDKNGQATFENLRLGEKALSIQKRAFAPVVKDVTIGWGSNPLGEQRLTPTGSQYALVVTDFLSGEPLKGIEASSGEYSALSDESGKILLTVDEPDIDLLSVAVAGDNYRTETYELVLDNQDTRELQLVPGRKHLFVSKRTGTYDLYAIDVDGKNEELLLPGTGSEKEDMSILPHPTKEYAVYVSTRENKRNQDGFLLSTLTAVDVNNKTNKTIVTSERVQLIDWIGDHIVYVRVAEGASTSNPQRHKLMSYNVESGQTTELAASNYFNDVMVANDIVFYAPASAFTPSEQVGLFSVEADGNNQKRVINKEIWGLFRLSAQALTLSAQQEWFEYKLEGSDAPGAISQPVSLVSRAYVDNPSKNKSLWVDSRDGKGVLLSYDYESNKDEIILSESGLRSPVRWVSDTTLIYRIVTGTETADYVLNIEGGEPKKIIDVTNTNSVDGWYYY